MSIDLFKLVNKEQLLNLALGVLNERDDDVAESIVIWYIVSESPNYNEEEIAEKYTELLVGYATQSMYKKGWIDISFDENGEIVYNISSAGKQVARELDI